MNVDKVMANSSCWPAPPLHKAKVLSCFTIYQLDTNAGSFSWITQKIENRKSEVSITLYWCYYSSALVNVCLQRSGAPKVEGASSTTIAIDAITNAKKAATFEFLTCYAYRSPWRSSERILNLVAVSKKGEMQWERRPTHRGKNKREGQAYYALGRNRTGNLVITSDALYHWATRALLKQLVEAKGLISKYISNNNLWVLRN